MKTRPVSIDQVILQLKKKIWDRIEEQIWTANAHLHYWKGSAPWKSSAASLAQAEFTLD